ncbi:hypothetical protein GGH13_009079, partial [Coemansia sp. S155-1]
MDNPACDRGKQPNVPAACQSEAENGKGRASMGDSPEAAPLDRQVNFNRWVRVLEISLNEKCD